MGSFKLLNANQNYVLYIPANGTGMELEKFHFQRGYVAVGYIFNFKFRASSL